MFKTNFTHGTNDTLFFDIVPVVIQSQRGALVYVLFSFLRNPQLPILTMYVCISFHLASFALKSRKNFGCKKKWKLLGCGPGLVVMETIASRRRS